MDPLIDILAPGLAIAALAGLAGLVVHSARNRRGWFGRRGVTQLLARVIAILALAAAFGASAGGPPVASRSFAAAPPAVPEGALQARTVTTSWRLPFYTQTTARDATAEGVELGRRVTRSLTLPWPFLLVAMLYVMAVRATA